MKSQDVSKNTKIHSIPFYFTFSIRVQFSEITLIKNYFIDIIVIVCLRTCTNRNYNTFPLSKCIGVFDPGLLAKNLAGHTWHFHSSKDHSPIHFQLLSLMIIPGEQGCWLHISRLYRVEGGKGHRGHFQVLENPQTLEAKNIFYHDITFWLF